MLTLKIILLALLFHQNPDSWVDYKSETNYIIQEVVYGWPEIYPPFACFLRLKTDYDLYYIADEDYLLNAIAADSINLDSLTYLIPHYSNWEIFDSVQNKYRDRICFSQRLDDLMTMDNTEVYKIGSKYYAIKKIRYAYLDDIEVYRSLYNIVRDGTDDIQIEKKEEEYYRTTYKTIKEYLPNRKYQYYLFLQDICETDKAIKEHLWKRRYELNEFWIKYVETCIQNHIIPTFSDNPLPSPRHR